MNFVEGHIYEYIVTGGKWFLLMLPDSKFRHVEWKQDSTSWELCKAGDSEILNLSLEDAEVIDHGLAGDDLWRYFPSKRP